MSYTTITPAVPAIPERKIHHAYCIGQTIEGTGKTIEKVTFGNTVGDFVAQACYHYVDRGEHKARWDLVTVIDAKYPKPVRPVTTTTIVIEEYIDDSDGHDICYGRTDLVLQCAVEDRVRERVMEGERWVITTTTDAIVGGRPCKPTTVVKPEHDTV